MQYTTGQIVRTHPDKFGHFCVYRIDRTQGGLASLLVSEIDRNTGKDLESNLVVHPDTVELFQTENAFGALTIGDKVRCMGLEGEHILLGFYTSRLTKELKAIVSYGEDERGSIPWILEFVRKI